MTDYSPEGVELRKDLDRTTVAQLAKLEPENDRDRIAADLLSERLRSSLALEDAGESLRSMRNIGSPWQAIRTVFDVMPRGAEADWETIASRLELVPYGLATLRSALEETTKRGLSPARRQVLACAEQGDTWAGRRQHRPYFGDLADGYKGDDPALRTRLETAAGAATEAYGAASQWLRNELAPLSSAHDAVGRDRYALADRAVARYHRRP